MCCLDCLSSSARALMMMMIVFHLLIFLFGKYVEEKGSQ